MVRRADRAPRLIPRNRECGWRSLLRSWHVPLLGLLVLLLAGCAAAMAPAESAEQAAVPSSSRRTASGQVAMQSAPAASSPGRPSPHSGRGDRRGRQPEAQLPPVVPTSLETTSTFGLDADDASWRRSLALARQGYILEPDDVRVEEWLNALRWDYERPEGEETFQLDLTVTRDPLDPDSWLALMGLSAAAPAEMPTRSVLSRWSWMLPVRWKRTTSWKRRVRSSKR